MNRNSHNLRGSSTLAGYQNPRWRTVFIALMLALTIGSVGQTPPAQAAPRRATEVGFFMLANKERPGQVCVGELVLINALVYRYKLIDGVSQSPDTVTGVLVSGIVDNADIGQLSPPTNTTIWASSIYPGAADFVFTAEKPGNTTITFYALVATRGWFGSKYGGSVMTVSAQVDVDVIPCKFKVKTNSKFSAQGVTIMSTLDGEMKADEQGNFTGSATVNWIGSPSASGNCRGTIDIASSQADLTGSMDDSDQLVAEVTYLPAALTHNFCCQGICATDTALVTPDAVTMSVPSSGGVFTQSQDLYEPNFYSMHGSTNIVVIPVEDEAVSFIPADHAANWDGFSSLLGALLALR